MTSSVMFRARSIVANMGVQPYSGCASRLTPVATAHASPTCSDWSPDEQNTLARLRHQGLDFKSIARQLGRTYGAVKYKHYQLRISTPKTSERSRAAYTIRSWTDDEDAQLKALRTQGKPFAEIASVLQRSGNSVRSRWRNISSHAPPRHSSGRYWSEEEDALLVSMKSNGESYSAMAAALKRSFASVAHRLATSRNKIDGHGSLMRSAPKPFTEQEDQLLIRLKSEEKRSWDAIKLQMPDRNYHSLRNRLYHLLQGHLHGRARRWTKAELQHLFRLRASGVGVKELASRFGRAYSSIVSALHRHSREHVGGASARWTLDHESDLISYKQTLGLSWEEIALRLGREPTACRVKWSTDLKYRPATIKKPATEHEDAGGAPGTALIPFDPCNSSPNASSPVFRA